MAVRAPHGAEVLIREREFHDALAAPLKAAALPPRDPDALEQALLKLLGDVRGTRVLEIGCGTGDLSLLLLRAGASLTALDLSTAMVDIARNRAMQFAPNGDAVFFARPVEETGLPDCSYDLVVGKWILHHADIIATADEVSRVLQPGGRAVFIENSGLNRPLMFARNHLAGRFGIPRYGTADEHPLEQADYAYYRTRFARVSVHFPDFCFLQLLDRQVFKHRSKRINRWARQIDDALWRRLLRLRRYSYHVILEASKA
jgi:ubiquinone/menaquinone biosynthesis C-methylase UbiE